jgi:hypothetical protein
VNFGRSADPRLPGSLEACQWDAAAGADREGARRRPGVAALAAAAAGTVAAFPRGQAESGFRVNCPWCPACGMAVQAARALPGPSLSRAGESVNIFPLSHRVWQWAERRPPGPGSSGDRWHFLVPCCHRHPMITVRRRGPPVTVTGICGSAGPGWLTFLDVGSTRAAGHRLQTHWHGPGP